MPNFHSMHCTGKVLYTAFATHRCIKSVQFNPGFPLGVLCQSTFLSPKSSPPFPPSNYCAEPIPARGNKEAAPHLRLPFRQRLPPDPNHQEASTYRTASSPSPCRHKRVSTATQPSTKLSFVDTSPSHSSCLAYSGYISAIDNPARSCI